MISLQVIGRIESPFTTREDAPRQGYLSEALAHVHLDPAFAPAAAELVPGDRLELLYFAHQSDREVLRSRPPHGRQELGVFATRSPNRPNPILVCIVRLVKREGLVFTVSGLDALDGSLLLDIKGYSKALHDARAL